MVAYLAELEERLTIAPPGFIRAPIFWQRKNVASAFTVCTRRQSSTVTSKIGRTITMPAELTSQ